MGLKVTLKTKAASEKASQENKCGKAQTDVQYLISLRQRLSYDENIFNTYL